MMTIGAHVKTWSNGCIGKYEIDLVHRKVGNQTFECSLMADDADRLFQVKCRLKQAVGDLLRHDVVDPDGKPQRTPCRTMLQCIQEVASEAENLIGVAVHETTHFCRDERTTRLGQ